MISESSESSESSEDLRHAGAYVKCKHCKGTGKIKGKHNYNLESPHVKRLLGIMGIMGRNKLSVQKTAQLLDLTATAVYNWLHKKTNPKGEIRKIYFLCLKLRGYK